MSGDIDAVIARVKAQKTLERGAHVKGACVALSVRDRDAILARIAALEGALEPFARVAERDIGDDENDRDAFLKISEPSRRGPRLTVGHFRRARALLTEKEKTDGE